jgi:alanine racemase
MTPHAGFYGVFVRMFSAQPSGSSCLVPSSPPSIPRSASPQPRSRAPLRRSKRASGPWSRPTPTGTASSGCFDAFRGADGFALLDLAEAERVRALGWRGPVLLARRRVRAARPRTLLAPRISGIPCIATAQIDMAGRPQDTGAAARVPEDEFSGMNRLGFAPERVPFSAWTRLNALPQVDEISLMTHFSDADGTPRHRRTSSRCLRAPPPQDLPGERSMCQQRRHCCATRPSLRGAQSLSADWVRPGIAALRQRPRLPRDSDAARLAAAARNDAFHAADHRHADPEGRRHHRLRLHASPPTVRSRVGVAAVRLWRTAIRGTATPARRCW